MRAPLPYHIRLVKVDKNLEFPWYLWYLSFLLCFPLFLFQFPLTLLFPFHLFRLCATYHINTLVAFRKLYKPLYFTTEKKHFIPNLPVLVPAQFSHTSFASASNSLASSTVQSSTCPAQCSFSPVLFQSRFSRAPRYIHSGRSILE